jgi:hypothetical protein
MTTLTGHDLAIQIKVEGWTAVTIRKSADKFPRELMGRAVFRAIHHPDKPAFYVEEPAGTWVPKEYINGQWFEISYEHDQDYFFTKPSMHLQVTNLKHPNYVKTTTAPPREPATTSSTEGITAALASAPVFEDIAEDTQPPQPRRDYMLAVMPATIPLRLSRFDNSINDPRSATNNQWGAAQAQIRAQTQAETLASLNPDVV